LRGLGIDNVRIDLSQCEVPIMDGSAAPWVYLIQDAGVKVQTAPRKTLQVLRQIQHQHGDKRIALYPFDGFKVSYTITFDHPMLRHQQKTMELDEQTFVDHVAPARTFGFLKDVEMLRQRGLALGGSLENAVVVGETGVLNPLRFEDEFVRHKIWMSSVTWRWWVIPSRAIWWSIAVDTRFTRHSPKKILRQTDAWQLVESASDVVPSRAAARAHAASSPASRAFVFASLNNP
jgi:UDP-3-O-acyl N-acetylglucosamine deacetylase